MHPLIHQLHAKATCGLGVLATLCVCISLALWANDGITNLLFGIGMNLFSGIEDSGEYPLVYFPALVNIKKGTLKIVNIVVKLLLYASLTSAQKMPEYGCSLSQ